MTIRLDQFIKTIATALDIVEGELLGASTHHGKRIASLCVAMGRSLNMNQDSLFDLAACALLHDSALTEYIQAETRRRKSHDTHTHYDPRDPSMKLHCEYGERNAKNILFPDTVDGFVLYHHEQADGKGLFGKKEGETPLEAQLISIADSIDVTNHLQRVSLADLPIIRHYVTNKTGTYYTRRAAKAMLEVLNQEMLESLRDENIKNNAEAIIPPKQVEITDQVIYRLADVITRIIDYKSAFTCRHSTQIANKVWVMAEHYGYDPVQRNKVYLASVLHDIGKLAIPTDILEKPAKLSAEEYRIITSHITKTQEILKEIDGMEDVCAWAGNHHEKLDGTGYPRGLKSGEMDFNSRLMACLDIYEAVSEERPYHPARNHKDTMAIMDEMARKGYLDQKITSDIDRVLAPYDGGEVEPPPLAKV